MAHLKMKLLDDNNINYPKVDGTLFDSELLNDITLENLVTLKDVAMKNIYIAAYDNRDRKGFIDYYEDKNNLYCPFFCIGEDEFGLSKKLTLDVYINPTANNQLITVTALAVLIELYGTELEYFSYNIYVYDKNLDSYIKHNIQNIYL